MRKVSENPSRNGNCEHGNRTSDTVTQPRGYLVRTCTESLDMNFLVELSFLVRTKINARLKSGVVGSSSVPHHARSLCGRSFFLAIVSKAARPVALTVPSAK